jgi:hypothetical protein
MNKMINKTVALAMAMAGPALIHYIPGLKYLHKKSKRQKDFSEKDQIAINEAEAKRNRKAAKRLLQKDNI